MGQETDNLGSPTHSSAAQSPCLASGSLLRNLAAGMLVQLLANHHNLSVRKTKTLQLTYQICHI